MSRSFIIVGFFGLTTFEPNEVKVHTSTMSSTNLIQKHSGCLLTKEDMTSTMMYIRVWRLWAEWRLSWNNSSRVQGRVQTWLKNWHIWQWQWKCFELCSVHYLWFLFLVAWMWNGKLNIVLLTHPRTFGCFWTNFLFQGFGNAEAETTPKKDRRKPGKSVITFF